MKDSEKIASFTTGFVGYPLLEIGWRGKTHWSMALAGGLAVLLLYPCCSKAKLHHACLKTAGIVTGLELVFGCVFNLLLGRAVWDYSKMRHNLWGQICLAYSALWFLLGIPVRFLCGGIHRICKDLP